MLDIDQNEASDEAGNNDLMSDSLRFNAMDLTKRQLASSSEVIKDFTNHVVEDTIPTDEEQEGRIVSTIIIILFMMHPSITRAMFNAFKYAYLAFILLLAVKKSKETPGCTRTFRLFVIAECTERLHMVLPFQH